MEAFGWKYFEKATNNEAEYRGLISGLEYLDRKGLKQVTIKGDSKVIVEQVSQICECRAPNLWLLCQKALIILRRVKGDIHHVMREENSLADAVCGRGILRGEDYLVELDADKVTTEQARAYIKSFKF